MLSPARPPCPRGDSAAGSSPHAAASAGAARGRPGGRALARATPARFEPLEAPSGPEGGVRTVLVADMTGTGPVDYATALGWQNALVAAKLDGRLEEDVLVVVEHSPPCFTLGTGSDRSNLKFDPDGGLPAGFELHRSVGRGGEATYHGPGQVVLYPVLDLRRYRQDLHWHLSALEETVVRACIAYGVEGASGGVDGLTGVWIDGAKVAATGVRAQRWVTSHGIAWNVGVDLSHFSHIVPCGIADRPVQSLDRVIRRRVDVRDAAGVAVACFADVYACDSVPLEPSEASSLLAGRWWAHT